MHTMSMRQHQSEQARPGERAHRHVVRILCGVGRKKRLVGMLIKTTCNVENEHLRGRICTRFLCDE
jgi:hypothetical protein